MKILEVSQLGQVLKKAEGHGTTRVGWWMTRNLKIIKGVMAEATQRLINVALFQDKIKRDNLLKSLEDLARQKKDTPDSWTNDHEQLVTKLLADLEIIKAPTDEQLQAFYDSDQKIAQEEIDLVFYSLKVCYLPGWDNEKEKVFNESELELFQQFGLITE